ncbi:MAG: glycosyltransferase family 39 protein [Acidimicrobiales bacterium]|nr:glycosyltransferase family 39 protein [Acidimicrobiales bacterium]
MTRPRASVAALLVAVACSAYGIVAIDGRPAEQGTWDVTGSWLAGLAALVALGAAGRGERSGEPWWQRARRSLRRPAVVAGCWIVGVGALARLVALARFPTVIDADEGTLLLQAQRARAGQLPNPWTSSFFSAPDLYRAWQGWVAAPFGEGIAAHRTLSALVGVACVALAWRLGVRVLGTLEGLAGAGFLALLPLHLWASRNGLNNITHAATCLGLLLALHRAVDLGRRSDALAAGAVVGVGTYGYTGGTVFVAVLVACVAVAGLRLDVGWRSAAALLGWALLATVAVAAPLIGHFIDVPDRVGGRFEQVREVDPTLADRLGDVVGGVTFPLRPAGPPSFYRVDGPFLGWVLGLLVLGGLATWAWRSVRRRPGVRPELLLTAYVVLLLPISQTDAMASQRWLAVTGLWALAGATALVALGRAVVDRTPLPAAAALVAGVVVVAGVGLVSATRFYDEDQQVTAYADRRTVAAYDLGWRLDRAGRPVALVSVGLPFLPFTGFGNLRFQAPEAVVAGREEPPIPDAPGDEPAPPPVAGADDLVAITAERVATDDCRTTAANPHAARFEARDRRGELLYVLVAPRPVAVPTGPTPAGTTLTSASGVCRTS